MGNKKEKPISKGGEWKSVNVKEKEFTMSECCNRDEEEVESTRVRQAKRQIKNESVSGTLQIRVIK